MKRRLYVISSSLGLVKVGVSASPRGRCGDLQAVRHDKLELEWQSPPIADCIAVERVAHKLLKAYREKGEWFTCDKQVAIDACQQAIEQFKSSVKRDGFTRLAVSCTPEDIELITRLRAHLEAKNGGRYSLARVVREALDCLANKEGVK